MIVALSAPWIDVDNSLGTVAGGLLATSSTTWLLHAGSLAALAFA